ncbi:hypothetical protein OAT18_03685 [Tenacibaculum sp.]|nr:hypothetical protein [Tenacibaculum sp.]
MSNQTNVVPLKAPVKNPHNIEATKYYIFNETGNILMASTVDSGAPLSQEVQDVFSEVSVFFAGMSRAIATTINPETKKPYSLYNYTALQRVISGSGLFVHVNEEDVSYKTNQYGANFSKELLEALLGLATGAGALSFASAMMSSIGKEGVNIGGGNSGLDDKVGNIIFICEYLLGMPVISAKVIYTDAKQHKQQFTLGPCFKESSVSTEWVIHRDTYMFVTPKFIKNYAGDLDSINSSAEYLEMIDWFSGLLLQTPLVNEVVLSSNNEVVQNGKALNIDVTYRILGQFLGNGGALKFKKGAGNIQVKNWSTNGIEFTVSGTQVTSSPIQVVNSDNKIIATTTDAFTISK